MSLGSPAGVSVFQTVASQAKSADYSEPGLWPGHLERRIRTNDVTAFFPIRLAELQADIQFDSGLNDRFNIGSLQIDSIPNSHSAGTLGYRFKENGSTFVFLTDNELGFDHPQSRGVDAYRQFSMNADLLIHDAEYTQDEYRRRKGWGHSSIPHVLDLALKAGVGQLGLTHLNKDRTDMEMDAIVKEGNLFFSSRNSKTQCFGVACDLEIVL